jgi:hypothetical protein
MTSLRSVARAWLLLTGFALFGFACKSDGGGDGAKDGGKISGTYEAKSAEGNMTLAFKGQKVDVTMQEAGGQPDTKEADYMVNGNEITIQVPGGVAFVVTRDGNTLSGSMMGQIMHFEKK